MAKKLKIKLPKRVAGVKVPKSIRKGPVADFLNSGAGQVLLAQALVAAAGALAVSKAEPDSGVGEFVRHPVDKARSARKVAARVTADQAARFSFAFKEAVRAFRTALQVEAPDDSSWPKSAADLNLESVAKKKPSSRSAPRTPH